MRTLLILALTLVAADGVAERDLGEWQSQFEVAAQHYDRDAAQALLDEVTESLGEDCTDCEEALVFQVRSALLVAELSRIEFEAAPEDDNALRRELGEQIDAAAETGLEVLDRLPESPETLVGRADLYGTMIRSKYRAVKFRRKMKSAIEDARALDPSNPDADMSEARLLLFAPENHGGDLEAATALLDKYLAQRPGDERGLLLKAHACILSSDPAQAEALWERVLLQNPDCAPALRERELLKQR